MKKVISGVITSLKTSIRNEWDTWWESEFSVATPEHYRPYVDGINITGQLSIEQVKSLPYWTMANDAVQEFQKRLFEALFKEYNLLDTYNHSHFMHVLLDVFGETWDNDLQVLLDKVETHEWEHREPCDVFVKNMITTFMDQLVEIMTSEWSEAFYFGFFEEMDGIKENLPALGITPLVDMADFSADPQSRICIIESDDVTYESIKTWDESQDVIEWLRQGLENAHLQRVIWLVNGQVELDMAHHTLNTGDIIKKCLLKLGANPSAVNH